MNVGNWDVAQLSEEAVALLEEHKADIENFGAKEAVGLVNDSVTEKPALTLSQRIADVKGKIKHWLRGRIAFGVDILWGSIEDEAGIVAADAVEIAFAQGQLPGDTNDVDAGGALTAAVDAPVSLAPSDLPATRAARRPAPAPLGSAEPEVVISGQ